MDPYILDQKPGRSRKKIWRESYHFYRTFWTQNSRVGGSGDFLDFASLIGKQNVFAHLGRKNEAKDFGLSFSKI